jgi:conjugal transfer/type IV secretion protein DotA/TraY
MGGSNPLTPSNSDLSVQLLDKILGAGWQSFGGNPNGFFQTILGIFDSALFAIVAVIAVYSLMMGLVEAAHDGVPLGKRYSKWMPFRIIAAGAFLAPVSNGISIVQAVFLSIAGMGVGLADNVWNAGTQYLITSGPAVVYSMDTGTELAKNALHSLVCQAWVNNNYYFLAQGNQKDLNGNPLAPPPTNWISENSTSGTFTITNPSSSGYGSYFGASPGGSVTTNVTEGVSFDGSSGTGIPPGACGSFTYDYNSSTPGSSLMSNAQATALKQMLGTLAPLANAIVGTPTSSGTPATGAPTLPDPAPLFTAINNYQTAVAKAAASVSSQGTNASSLSAWQSQAQTGGWLTMGAFYYAFTHQNEALSKLVSRKWSYQGVAVDAFADIPGNGNFSLKNTLSSVDGYTKILDQAGNFAGNPPTAAQMATASGEASNGTSGWGKALSILSSPMTGLITSFATMTTENGDPLLTLQSYGNSVIVAGETILMGSTGLLAAVGAQKGVSNGVSHIPVIGGVIGAVGGAISGAETGVLKIVVPVVLVVVISLVTLGAGLAYITPALPFIFITFGTLWWVLYLIEGLVAIPLWGLAHAQPEGEGFLSQDARTGYLHVLHIFLKPTFMVFGFFSSFMLLEALMTLVTNGFGAMVSGLTAGSFTGVVGMISLLVILNVLVGGSMALVFQQTLLRFDRWIVSWIGIHGPEDPGAPQVDHHAGISTLGQMGSTAVGAYSGTIAGNIEAKERADKEASREGKAVGGDHSSQGGRESNNASIKAKSDGAGNLNEPAQSQD